MIKYYHSTTNVKEFLINFQLLTFHIQILLSVGEVLGGVRGGGQVVERNFLDGVRLLAADDAVNGEGEGLGLLGAVLGLRRVEAPDPAWPAVLSSWPAVLSPEGGAPREGPCREPGLEEDEEACSKKK